MSAQLDLLDALFAFRTELTKLIVLVDAPPESDDETTLNQLVQMRDRVNAVINRVIDAKVTEATTGLEDALKKVGTSTSNLQATTKDIDGVKRAIAVASQVVGAVSAVLSAAAAVL